MLFLENNPPSKFILPVVIVSPKTTALLFPQLISSNKSSIHVL
nr:MAG TPA: hypothetical protein [Bacteriophage sp.]